MKNKLMTHIVAGYPSIKASEEVAKIMIEAGVDFLEIQIPFSDPVADGNVIMKANQEAVERGVKVEDSFKLMKKLKAGKTKLLFMTYFNIVHHYGVEKFCKKAKKCGAYGLIVPDMPIDEERRERYLKTCGKYGLKAIQVISPLTPERRLKMIAKKARGFVYCVSRYGTTGGSATLNPKLSQYLKKVKKHIKLPLAVGFGISKKEHVEAVWRNAEIAVIGSAIIQIINKSTRQNLPSALKKFLKSTIAKVPKLRR